MRILLATDAWEPQVNGVVRTLTRTVAECRAMGHEVEVVQPELFKTVPCPTYPEIRLALGAYDDMQERFKAFEPEAVHIATEGPVGLSARRICLEWKLPFTTSYHTKFPEYVSARFPVPVSVGYAYMRWFHKSSGRLMVATPSMRDELSRHGFRNISPWSRGVDTELFRPGLKPIYEGVERPIWLNVGRVAVEKNIEAFLKLDLPGTKVIVGDGPAREELSKKYPGALFTGAAFGDELARHFSDADAFVFPSLTDTFGLVILEFDGQRHAGGGLSGARPDRHHSGLGRGRRRRGSARGLPGLPGARPERRAGLRGEVLVARLGRGVRAQPPALSRAGEDPLLAQAAPPGPAAPPDCADPLARFAPPGSGSAGPRVNSVGPVWR